MRSSRVCVVVVRARFVCCCQHNAMPVLRIMGLEVAVLPIVDDIPPMRSFPG